MAKFNVKYIFLVLGMTLLTIAAFSTFDISYHDYSLLNDIAGKESGIQLIPGHHHHLWYVIFGVCAILLAIGFFRSSSINKVLFYIFLPLLNLVVFFLSYLLIYGINGTESPENYPPGLYYSLIGELLIVVAIILSLHQPGNNKTDKKLLDN